jgi:hypothetical protein
MTINMSDTASSRAIAQLDPDIYQNDGDGIDPQPYTVSSFTFSDRDTDSSLTVMFCGLRMYVDIFAVNLQRSSKRLDEYLHFLKVADAYELDGLTVDDFYDWVLEGCSSTFADVTPPALPTIPSLADYLYPATRCYSLHANEYDQLELIETANDPRKRVCPGTRVHENLCYSWPSFTPSQVIICADNAIEALQHAPRKVRVANRDAPLFFKPYVLGGRRTAERELRAYTQIKQASFSQLRTSSLFGLVQDDSGWLLGLLLSHIDCEALTLHCAITTEVSLSMPQYWAAEIDETLTRLHEAGIIWGDANAANILVDAHNDPWIVDFGGGYTPGWVDKDLAGTIEGDKKGLSRIMDYIFE